MKLPLPPLASLRAFESAARHGGFVGAAAELNVTPGSISHHLRVLEEWLDRKLFIRKPNGITLTPAGTQYAVRVSVLLRQIAEASEVVKNPERNKVVVVRCQISFATKWLLPRIGAFNALHPEIQIVIRAEPYSPDPFRGGADLAIDYSRGPLAGTAQHGLAQGNFIVAAAPEFLESIPGPLTPRHFLEVPLVHCKPIDRGWSELDWPAFLASHGIRSHARLPGSITVSMMHLAIDACAAGFGLGLLQDIFIGAELANGRLVQAFDCAQPAPHGYFLYVPEKDDLREEIVQVKDWLLNMA